MRGCVKCQSEYGCDGWRRLDHALIGFICCVNYSCSDSMDNRDLKDISMKMFALSLMYSKLGLYYKRNMIYLFIGWYKKIITDHTYRGLTVSHETLTRIAQPDILYWHWPVLLCDFNSDIKIPRMGWYGVEPKPTKNMCAPNVIYWISESREEAKWLNFGFMIHTPNGSISEWYRITLHKEHYKINWRST